MYDLFPAFKNVISPKARPTGHWPLATYTSPAYPLCLLKTYIVIVHSRCQLYTSQALTKQARLKCNPKWWRMTCNSFTQNFYIQVSKKSQEISSVWNTQNSPSGTNVHATVKVTEIRVTERVIFCILVFIMNIAWKTWFVYVYTA